MKTDPKALIYSIFEKHVPDPVSHYCFDLWEEYRFNFLVAKKRSTKLGDYRYSGHEQSHTITINNNLNKYSFLVTYLHEVAHLLTYSEYKNKVSPHGHQWKNNFQQLLIPILNDLVFPADIIVHLKNYINNPKASSCSDHNLAKALSAYDENENSLVHLSEVKSGNKFRFNRKVYQMEAVKRTRIICKELSSGRKFLISGIAQVEILA
ncbi:MAG: SprT-like domain-containing protein [Bacteroidota bacterium]|nr:SprT-like domain-containing protein [Bacteroidota bacterium]